MKGANKLKYFKNKDELLFYRTPAAFTKHSPLEVLKYAIGANLYMPGTQNNIFKKLIHNDFREIGAITLCLEDSIQEDEVAEAENNILKILNDLFLSRVLILRLQRTCHLSLSVFERRTVLQIFKTTRTYSF